MFTTLCVLLGLRVTQPWHIPTSLFIFLFPHIKLSTTLSGTWRVKTKTQQLPGSVLEDVARHTGFKIPALGALRFLHFQPWDIHFGGENTCAALLQPL